MPALAIAAMMSQKEEKMQAIAKTTVLMAVAALGSASAAWALPFVSNVRIEQKTDTRMVEITYDLGVEDAIVTLVIETNGVAIPDSAVTRLSGDVCKVVGQGTNKSITWNAVADWPDNVTTTATARVTAWCTNAPPEIIVVDLTGGAAAETYPVFYYTTVEALPGAMTNASYKSSRLVMRKITRGRFSMGSGTGVKEVMLTRDFYAGIYQVTQGQWSNVMGNALSAQFTDAASRAFRPMEKVSYEDIRGTEAQGGAGWPANADVYANSFMGLLRSKTGLTGFDLPTEAQWEYACRAGTMTYYNDDIEGTPSSTSNAQMNVLGRYRYNGGYSNEGTTSPGSSCGPENGTAIVGSYRPNTWGLYDMHGNVFEWCLDWYDATLEGGVNPSGPASSVDVKRVKLGGGWQNLSQHCFRTYRDKSVPSLVFLDIGFRLVMTLP